MKLFIDDIRPAPKGWYLAKTVTEAIRLLDEYDWTVISFDHDIFTACLYGGEETITKMKGIVPFNAHKSKEDFTAVARFLVQKHPFPKGCVDHACLICLDGPISHTNAPGQVLIHTANPEGYKRLKEILEPFNPIRDHTYETEWENRK